MFESQKAVRTIAEVKKLFQPLKKDIENAPGCFSTATNPLLRPIYQAWENAQHDPAVEPELKSALVSPLDFVKAVATEANIPLSRMARGLRHRVGMFVAVEIDETSMVTVYKKGRLAGIIKTPSGVDWELTESTPFQDTFVRKSVLLEVQQSPEIDIFNGFHVNTSAALAGIERRKALVASAQLSVGDELKTGEVFGTNGVHRQVYVHCGKIADGYGIPGWFDEYSLVFGVSIEKQRLTLASQGKCFGLWSSSEGYEIGEEVPLENITVISAPAVKLEEIKKWAAKNIPHAMVISREAIYLKYGK